MWKTLYQVIEGSPRRRKEKEEKTKKTKAKDGEGQRWHNSELKDLAVCRLSFDNSTWIFLAFTTGCTARKELREIHNHDHSSLTQTASLALKQVHPGSGEAKRGERSDVEGIGTRA